MSSEAEVVGSKSSSRVREGEHSSSGRSRVKKSSSKSSSSSSKSGSRKKRVASASSSNVRVVTQRPSHHSSDEATDDEEVETTEDEMEVRGGSKSSRHGSSTDKSGSKKRRSSSKRHKRRGSTSTVGTDVAEEGQMFVVDANGELKPVAKETTSSGSKRASGHSSALLQGAVSGAVLAKKDRLLRQIAMVERRMQEVKMYRKWIESETRADMEAMIARLAFTENAKLSVLHRDLEELKADVKQIDEFEAQLQEEETPSMASFLARYEEIQASCARIIEKPFKAVVDVVADDFEQENRERIEIIRSHDELVRLLHLKDQLVWNAIEENLHLKKQLAAERSQREQESKQWRQLVARYEAALDTDQSSKKQLQTTGTVDLSSSSRSAGSATSSASG